VTKKIGTTANPKDKKRSVKYEKGLKTQDVNNFKILTWINNYVRKAT